MLELRAVHCYQTNEGRCARLTLALDSAPAGDRELAFFDVGTGNGLYVFAGPGERVRSVGARTPRPS